MAWCRYLGDVGDTELTGCVWRAIKTDPLGVAMHNRVFYEAKMWPFQYNKTN